MLLVLPFLILYLGMNLYSTRMVRGFSEQVYAPYHSVAEASLDLSSMVSELGIAPSFCLLFSFFVFLVFFVAVADGWTE